MIYKNSKIKIQKLLDTVQFGMTKVDREGALWTVYYDKPSVAQMFEVKKPEDLISMWKNVSESTACKFWLLRDLERKEVSCHGLLEEQHVMDLWLKIQSL